MDQLKHLEGVLVVGTCNYPDKIDAAVLRPGRFDIKVEVPLPGAKALARMLRDGLEGDVAASDLACLTRAAAGQSAADVDGALRQARSVARAEARDVRVTDVLLALNPDPQDENPARDWRIALHECGHAIVATSLGVGQIRRLNYRGQGGQTWIRFTSGEGLLSECEAELAYHLAGRAAERLILESVTAGSGGAACSDLARATLLAVRIDAQFGLGAEGLAWHDISTSQYLREPKNAARIRARLEAAEDRAMQVLKSQRAVLVEMSEDLQQNRLLEDDALKTWLAKVTRSQALTHL
jgi:ATP-dependent Zn protease